MAGGGPGSHGSTKQNYDLDQIWGDLREGIEHVSYIAGHGALYTVYYKMFEGFRYFVLIEGIIIFHFAGFSASWNDNDALYGTIYSCL